MISMNHRTRLAKLIKDLVVDLGSQSRLVKAMGEVDSRLAYMSRETVSAWVNGRSIPRDDPANALAQLLKERGDEFWEAHKAARREPASPRILPIAAANPSPKEFGSGKGLHHYNENREVEIMIRPAIESDFNFVTSLMVESLSPYYGGDHEAHAKRIFEAHIAGGKDRIGHFSYEQKMFVLDCGGSLGGILHLVGKRQGTYKISPMIVAPRLRGRGGFGTALLTFAEQYAQERDARQLYCTVAEQNRAALQFFINHGFVAAGKSISHYKKDVDEVMLYKNFVSPEELERFDRPNISVVPFDETQETQVRDLLADSLPGSFRGIDSDWLDALFRGYRRRFSSDINTKYKLLYIAVDRRDNVLGVVGATPKKGEPIKLMPFIARSLPAFVALLTDVPHALKSYGRLLYVHLTPTVDETIALQAGGWHLDAALPRAYHNDQVMQQWSLDISGEEFMRSMRVKQRFLDHIRSGRKTIEVRVGYSSIKTIQPGETIRFLSHQDSQIIRVNEVRRYITFEEMLESEESQRIVPGSGKAAVLELLREIYPQDRERLGVIVLDITADSNRVRLDPSG